MVEVRKRENESTGSLLRRFNKMLQQSGFLTRARGGRYHADLPSQYQKKKEALRRLAWQKDNEKQRKLGKIR
ncbi:MAG: 30S ribosomal protein S21 [bacterium]|nr:30S ribosomal protein S21 [bacterium]